MGGTDWDFLAHFRWVEPEEQVPGWDKTLSWVRLTYDWLSAELEGYEDHVQAWEDRLNRLGGELCRHDWRNFRPLRLTREEDWSDWLAWLLEKSKTGIFGAHVFRGTAEDMAGPVSVEREVTLSNGRIRADLVVFLRSGKYVHLEVKIGDMDLNKTFDTATATRVRFRAHQCQGDFILLLDSQRESWAEVASRKQAQQIDDRYWHDVAIGLRRALWMGGESDLWNGWALTFCGAVEQRLLGHPVRGWETVGQHGLLDLSGRLSHLQVMREGVLKWSSASRTS